MHAFMLIISTTEEAFASHVGFCNTFLCKDVAFGLFPDNKLSEKPRIIQKIHYLRIFSSLLDYTKRIHAFCDGGDGRGGVEV